MMSATLCFTVMRNKHKWYIFIRVEGLSMSFCKNEPEVLDHTEMEDPAGVTHLFIGSSRMRCSHHPVLPWQRSLSINAQEKETN